MKVKSQSEVDQLCPTLSDPMDCSPPGSSVHGIFQARVLEWGAIAFSDKPPSTAEKKEKSDSTCLSLTHDCRRYCLSCMQASRLNLQTMPQWVKEENQVIWANPVTHGKTVTFVLSEEGYWDWDMGHLNGEGA